MSSTGSKKRKLGEEAQKFYAVKSGRAPGVYRTWDDCKKNTVGWKNAVYKSFLTKQEAHDFVAGKTKPKPGQEKFYGVAVGHNPGVYTDWSTASEQIEGAKNPKYKKFDTRKEAEEFVESGGKMVKNVDATTNGTKGQRSEKSAKLKKVVAERLGEGEDLVVEEEEDDEGPSAKRLKTSVRTSVGAEGKSGWLRIYTDGSSRGNGQKGALAGVGVFFGVGDKRNVSEPLAGSLQTNNRAELTGVLRALEIAPKTTNVEIITDSDYSINCVSKWYIGWLKNKWRKATGAPVENQDLIKGIRRLIDERDALDVETVLTWVRGHNNDPGNEAADRLAVAGAMSVR